MRCPVCAEKYGMFDKGPSYWKSIECRGCGSELVMPAPSLGLLLSVLGYVALLPFAVFLIDYLSLHSWLYVVLVLAVIVCVIPAIIGSFSAEYSLDEGGFKRVLTVVFLLSIEFVLFSQINKMPEYALGVYHSKTGNLVTGGYGFSGVMFSGSGDLVSFVHSDRINGKAHYTLMVYNFLTHELREIAAVSDGNRITATVIVGDMEAIHCDYSADDNGLVRRITLNLQTGKWSEGIKPPDEKYPKNRFSTDSFDKRYAWKWGERHKRYIWDASARRNVKTIIGVNPCDCVWAPNKYRMVYEVTNVLPFRRDEVQLHYLEF